MNSTSPDRLLLDTNVVIAFIAGEPQATMRAERSSALFLPVPAIGELYRGALNSARVQENLNRLEQTINTLAVLACDRITAKYYGELKHLLRKRGRPIPENDIWIAALAAQHDLLLLTRDAHFKTLPEIKTEFLSCS